MKIRSLTMQGIGPFAGHEHIDFDDFEQSGLFLIQGKTGSGKTTILDAITYALWLIPSRSGDADDSRLRSDYAEQASRSCIDLVFESYNRTYRVSRSFAVTSDGSFTGKKQVLARGELTPEGFIDTEVLATKVKDIRLQLEQIIGLNADQFVQTVILPQGKFAQFLTSSPTERSAVLQSIFGTELYQHVETELGKRRTLAQKEISAAENNVHTACEVLINASEKLRHGLPQDDTSTPPEVLLDAASVLLAQWEEEASEESRKGEALKASVELAQGNVAQTRLVEENLRRLTTLEKISQDLADQRNEMNEAEVQWKIFNEVQQVNELWQIFDSRERQLKASQESFTQHCQKYMAAFRALPQLSDSNLFPFLINGATPLQIDFQEKDHWQNALNADRKKLTALREIAVTAETLSERRKHTEAKLLSLQQDFADTTARLETLESSREELPQLLLKAENSLKDSQYAVTQIPVLTASLDALVPRIEAARQVVQLQETLIIEEEKLAAVTVTAQEKSTFAHHLHLRWLSDSAASLAAELQDDEPCMVCGSRSHPDPAVFQSHPTNNGLSDETRTPVTLAAVQEADAEKARIDAQLFDLQTTIAHIRQERSDAQAHANGSLSELTLLQDSLSEQLEILQASASDLTQHEENLSQLKDKQHSILHEKATLEERLCSLKISIDESTKLLSEIDTDVEDLGLGEVSPQKFRELLQENEDLHAAVEKQFFETLGLLQSHHEAYEAASQSHAQLPPELASQPLRSFDHYLGREAEFQRLFEKLESYREKVAANSGACEEILGLLTDKLGDNRGLWESVKLPKLQEAYAELEDAEAQLHQWHESTAVRSHELQALQSATHTLRSALRKAEKKKLEYRAIIRMADIAQATTQSDAMRIPLASWVLKKRARDVLTAANARLRTISAGRYELRADGDQVGTRSGTRQGFSLNIMDFDSDTLRSTKSLSGGETFYISLAMALGLSDIVTAEKGGVHLESLFIDEGFGSLDSGTLDIVMNELSTLSGEGRTIGIISHVEEMAKIIGDKIDVLPAPQGKGSTLAISER